MRKIIKNKSVKERFFLHTKIVDDCWEWQIGKDKNGYGVFTINSKSFKAHRISYQLFVGEILPNKYVLHKCDNPPCVNPDHLFLGSAADNARDMVIKGRSLFGERATRGKLRIEDVLKIRKAYLKFGVTETSLARQFNVTQGAIGHIVNRRSWRQY